MPSAKAARPTASGPATAAGSGIPQRADVGCPGRTGRVACAALPQTVNTKSIDGAPGAVLPVPGAQAVRRKIPVPEEIERVGFAPAARAVGLETPPAAENAFRAARGISRARKQYVAAPFRPVPGRLRRRSITP